MDEEQKGIPCKWFAINEIKALCNKEVKFKRALQCIQGIQSHTLKIENDSSEMKIECKCSGTSNDSYQLSTKLSRDSNRLVYASCSCPYRRKFSKEDQLCKHTISLLLKHFCYDFIDERKGMALPSSATKPQAATHIANKVNVGDDKKRLLPDWMIQRHKRLGSKWSSESKTKNSIIPTVKQSRKKLKGHKSRIKRTVYLMTPEELLETAREILQESTSPEKPKKKTAENLPVTIERMEEITAFNRADEELSVPADETGEECGVEIKTLLLSSDSLDQQNCKVIEGDCEERPEVQWRGLNTADVKQEETEGSCLLESVNNEEYSILDELM